MGAWMGLEESKAEHSGKAEDLGNAMEASGEVWGANSDTAYVAQRRKDFERSEVDRLACRP